MERSAFARSQYTVVFVVFYGAGDRTRTYDPIITNDVLYQLSYTGAETLLWTY